MTGTDIIKVVALASDLQTNEPNPRPQALLIYAYLEIMKGHPSDQDMEELLSVVKACATLGTAIVHSTM